MMDNSGDLNSPNNIANVLDANRVPTNHVTVGRYISYLRDAFALYEAKRYDIKGKKYLSTQAKHYVCDSGMRYAVLGTRDMDWGRMYENAVFLELMRRGYETYVGKLYQKEVDFVAKRGSELVYIQVSDDISSESTLERELAPLMSVRDAFPKVLIDDGGERGSVQEGHVPVRQGRQEHMGRGAGSVAGKGSRQHREPLRRVDLQREDQAGLRGPQQAELPRQDLQGRHARLQRIPQGEQGGWLPLPKQPCHIVAAVPGAVRSSCRIFRKRSGTSASSIFCGASTVPASFAVS